MLGLNGLGKYTKRGGGMIVQSIVGGACFPPVTSRPLSTVFFDAGRRLIGVLGDGGIGDE